jgi:dihydrofolate synthase/folylpolyglutamate synthase
MPLTLEQALEYIHSFDDPYLAALRDHGKQTWGLATLRQLLEELGDPHLAYPTIHVAGTKGKGSTAVFITHGLIESGLKTGLYISPHLQDWRERIQIDRALISEGALGALVEDMQPHADRYPTLSAFEVTTALALWHFAREGCDAAVIEVGLGGRLDATSVVEPLVCVITNISFDHTQLLGDTLEQIAGEKAAIIKPGVPVVSGPQPPEAQAVIERRAEEQGSALTLVGRDWHTRILGQDWEGLQVEIGDGAHSQTYAVGLPGTFQAENATVALAALREAKRAGLRVTREGERKGLARDEWTGRLETIAQRPRVILDSAHNPYSMRRLVGALKALLGDRKVTFVFGCMGDKDIDGMLKALLPIASRLILTRADHPRAAEVDALREHTLSLTAGAKKVDTGPVVEAASGVENAVRLALEGITANDALCIAGSLSVAGEGRTFLLDGEGKAILESKGSQTRSRHVPA